jgi:hypothetical protein
MAHTINSDPLSMWRVERNGQVVYTTPWGEDVLAASERQGQVLRAQQQGTLDHLAEAYVANQRQQSRSAVPR